MDNIISRNKKEIASIRSALNHGFILDYRQRALILLIIDYATDVSMENDLLLRSKR